MSICPVCEWPTCICPTPRDPMPALPEAKKNTRKPAPVRKDDGGPHFRSAEEKAAWHARYPNAEFYSL